MSFMAKNCNSQGISWFCRTKFCDIYVHRMKETTPNGAVCDLVTFLTKYCCSFQVSSFIVVGNSNAKQTLLQYGSDRKQTLLFMSFSLFLFCILCFFSWFVSWSCCSLFLFATLSLIMREVLCNVYKKNLFIYTKQLYIHVMDCCLFPSKICKFFRALFIYNHQKRLGRHIGMRSLAAK